MTTLVALAAGFSAGVLVVALLWRHLVEARASRQLERWRADGNRGAVRRAVEEQRSGIKVQLGTELAPLLPAFPFEPADTRFLGHPVQFVVFAGHTALRDRRQTELAEVVLVNLRSEGRDLKDARLIDECVRAGRVRWVTLRVDAPSPEGMAVTALPVMNSPGMGKAAGTDAATTALRGAPRGDRRR